MKYWNWKKTSISVAVALVAFGTAVNMNPLVASAMDNIPVVGDIAKVVTFRNFTDAANSHQADIMVPQLKQGSPVNDEIRAYVDTVLAQYDKEAAKKPSSGQYCVHTDYEVVTDTDKYISLRINTEVLEAGGEQRVKIFTVDKATGKAVSLLDYLGSKENLDAASKDITAQMQAQMKADESKSYFIADDETADGFKGLTGNENFYLDKDGKTVVVFGEYEVAPGSMGVVSFTLAK